MSTAAKNLAVIQHTAAEYLGYIEEHLQGRGIRFRYFRPFTAGGRLPRPAEIVDGLVLLGGGPWGVVPGATCLPSLEPEMALVKAALADGVPVLGFGLGAQVLALAAGGSARAGALTFEVGVARRIVAHALGGWLPDRYPVVRYGRDAVALPEAAQVLARDERLRWALFQLGERAFGFAGHPGIKSAIIEDLIMEFAETPADTAAALHELRAVQTEIEAALAAVMAGLTQALRLMAVADVNEQSVKLDANG